MGQPNVVRNLECCEEPRRPQAASTVGPPQFARLIRDAAFRTRVFILVEKLLGALSGWRGCILLSSHLWRVGTSKGEIVVDDDNCLRKRGTKDRA